MFDQTPADALAPGTVVDGELVEEHLGPLVGVRDLDAGDEADGPIVLEGDEQMVAGLLEEPCRRLGRGGSVEQV